jgi:predicted small metal-binding protein
MAPCFFPQEVIMTRKHMNCTLALSADSEGELLEAAIHHAVTVHGHSDTPELRQQIRGLLKEGTPVD